MPNAFPQEFRDDVVQVARNRDSGVTLSQVARYFGISDSFLAKRVLEFPSQRSATAGV